MQSGEFILRNAMKCKGELVIQSLLLWTNARNIGNNIDSITTLGLSLYLYRLVFAFSSKKKMDINFTQNAIIPISLDLNNLW